MGEARREKEKELSLVELLPNFSLAIFRAVPQLTERLWSRSGRGYVFVL